MNFAEHNRKAWNKQSSEGSRWCTPVSSEEIEKARNGDWGVGLSPSKIVPTKWFGEIKKKDLLCLASGGGQQAPIFSAAGANVISYDISDEQLSKDRLVAERDNLSLETIQGEMEDLSVFKDASFDIIYHTVSNVYTQDVKKVWKECFRILKQGGRLLSGFMNPDIFLFDHEEGERDGIYTVKYKLPFSDLESLSEEKREKLIEKNIALEFGHSLEDQIGGQIQAGFYVTGFYEDYWDDDSTPLNGYMPSYIATLARKMDIE